MPHAKGRTLGIFHPAPKDQQGPVYPASCSRWRDTDVPSRANCGHWLSLQPRDWSGGGTLRLWDVSWPSPANILERTFLVSSHKPTVAGCIGRQDRRQPSVWPLDRQGFLLDWSGPVYAFSCEGQGMTKMWWPGRPMSDPVQVFGRRNAETVHALGRPASENLHRSSRVTLFVSAPIRYPAVDCRTAMPGLAK